MTEAIKVGDKVQVDMDSPDSSFHAVEGIVEELTPGKNHGYIRITKSNSRVEAHSPAGKRTYLYNLTKVEKPFTFKDIQKGDTIRRTKKYDKGAVEIREGEVTGIAWDYVTNGSLILAYASDTGKDDVTLELLDRPEKPQHWLETQPVGVIGLFGVGRYKKVLKKTAEDLWEVTFVVNNRTFKLNSEQCRDQWPSLKHETDDKIEWIK